MSYQSRSCHFSVMHVATNGDVARSGGYFEFNDGKRVKWPRLYMHVRIGSIDGAIWADKALTRFVLVQTNKLTCRLEKVTEMDAKELHAFKRREGIFYILAD